MAFISNEKREKLTKQTSQNYVIRKLFVALELAAALAFIILAFVAAYKDATFDGDRTVEQWWWVIARNEATSSWSITLFGWILIAIAAFAVGFGVVALILIFTIKSPKTIKEKIQELNSSALSGKKIKRNEKAADIVKARNTIEEEKKAK